ncbi:MAG: hypothetical protein DWQ19_09715 [Crenarchaeota archaeon]|nr:MAG: hypothetical protein DWQ19_09715 [Thermoproteota archaeon]
MIYACPFCGRKVWKIVESGISTCSNCGRIFDTSSSLHRILAAAWMTRLHQMTDSEAIQLSFELTDYETNIVKEYVVDKDYSHDELLKVLNCQTCS